MFMTHALRCVGALETAHGVADTTACSELPSQCSEDVGPAHVAPQTQGTLETWSSQSPCSDAFAGTEHRALLVPHAFGVL